MDQIQLILQDYVINCLLWEGGVGDAGKGQLIFMYPQSPIETHNNPHGHWPHPTTLVSKVQFAPNFKLGTSPGQIAHPEFGNGLISVAPPNTTNTFDTYGKFGLFFVVVEDLETNAPKTGMVLQCVGSLKANQKS